MPDEPKPDPEPTPTPPAPDPTPAPPENKELEELRRQNQALSENLQREQEQRAALDDRLKKLETPALPKSSDKELNERFYANPHLETRTIVREELQQTVAPLLDFVKSFQGDNAYTRLKSKYRSDVRFRPIFDRYEAYVDRAMQNVEPTDRALLGVLTSVAGAAQLGLIEGSSSSPDPGDPNVPNTPPHIRPSPPAPPKPPAKQPRQTSEEQRRLMRELGMTEDEYFQHYDSDRLTVPVADIVGGKK